MVPGASLGKGYGSVCGGMTETRQAVLWGTGRGGGIGNRGGIEVIAVIFLGFAERLTKGLEGRKGVKTQGD